MAEGDSYTIEIEVYAADEIDLADSAGGDHLYYWRSEHLDVIEGQEMSDIEVALRHMSTYESIDLKDVRMTRNSKHEFHKRAIAREGDFDYL